MRNKLKLEIEKIMKEGILPEVMEKILITGDDRGIQETWSGRALSCFDTLKTIYRIIQKEDQEDQEEKVKELESKFLAVKSMHDYASKIANHHMDRSTLGTAAEEERYSQVYNWTNIAIKNKMVMDEIIKELNPEYKNL